jgi:outer membrane protein assembly factor BamB
MTIINTLGRPVPSIEISAKNGTTTITKTTNAYGTAVFSLEEPGVYKFSYLDQKDVGTYEVREGFKGTARRTYTYDPDGHFAVKPKEDRTGVKFIAQSPYALKGKENVLKVTLHAKERSGVGVSGLEMDILSVAEGVKYTGRTNSMGHAIFYLRNNTQYEVDINGIEALHKFKVPDYRGGEMREVVYYEKTKVTEIAKGDTIIQRNISQASGTTTHLLFTLRLRNYEGAMLPHEPVYAKSESTDLVYEGITNENGECKFMLKKGHNYLINLKHEGNIAMIDCKNKKGFAMSQISRRYRGSDVIEEMIAEQKRQAEADANGFVTNHRATPIFEAQKPTDYLTRTSNGMKIDFKADGPMGTPTIVGNKMFAPECYYSPNYYCLNATTGEYIWGVQLGESGPSPAVFHNDVILINTESCTLYALDANTGELLWSKWLAGYLYTTPSAKGDNVFVVYENRSPNSKGESRVLANFDLRTGKTNWMKWLDDEAIASPVLADNEVHVASHSGKYYVFDQESGNEKVRSQSINAISSPTITDDGIYITVEQANKEQLVLLDKSNLNIKRRYNTDLNPEFVSDANLFENMNFNGSHPIVYKNKIVLLLDKDKLRAFDAKSEKLLWEKPTDALSNQIPIVANDRVVVAGRDGKIKSYNIYNGSSQELSNVEGEIDGQPIAHKGRLIISAGGILTVIRSLILPNWNQWNKDAEHNLNIR